MSNNGTVRVHYFPRQFLRTQDFADEQAYHVTMHRRHTIAHHTWGIVRGLELLVDEGSLFVQPGVAIDGYGRALVLSRKQPIDTGVFDAKESDSLNVWLVYNRMGSDQAPQGYAGCGDDGDVPYYRWQEQPLIQLEKPVDPFDPREPAGVPVGDLNFNPARTPPDDPQDDWPVFLGRVQRDRFNPDQPISVDPAGRPYAGLVGEKIVAPSGRAQVQLGPESGDDQRRFAVFVPEVDKKQPRLEIDSQGEIGIRGDTSLYGNVKLENGAIEFGVGIAKSRRPWQIYRHLEQRSDPQNPQQQIFEHQLRVEMAGGGNGHNQVAIGTWSVDEEKFVPCLTVDDNCTVTVRGDLRIEGRISEKLIEKQPRPDPGLTTQAKDFLAATKLSGTSGANVMLGQFYPESSTGEVDLAALVRQMMTSERGRQALAKGIQDAPDLFPQIRAMFESQAAEGTRRGRVEPEANEEVEGEGDKEKRVD